MTSDSLSAGIDVGTSAVKCSVIRSRFEVPTAGAWPAQHAEVLALYTDRIRRRDLHQVVERSFAAVLEAANVEQDDLAYIATTGEGEGVDFARGHFYGMTTHARGALFLMPDVTAVIDVGALHARAMRVDARGRVLGYRMTSQCASGSGQFLENVARYLGVPLEEAGLQSRDARRSESVSSICAVLAETDVINMVSRGIPTAEILKGIHLSMAGRYVKLLRAVGADAAVALTGGLANDLGLVRAMEDLVAEESLPFRVGTHEHSIYAGALGAALWGAYRHWKLAQPAKPVTSSAVQGDTPGAGAPT